MLSSSLGRELQRIGSGFLHAVIELRFGEISKDGLNLRAIISNFVVFSSRYCSIEREIDRGAEFFLHVFIFLKSTKSGSDADNTSNFELCFFAGLAQGENKEVTHLRGRFE